MTTPKIMVVDDSNVIRNKIKTCLGDTPYEFVGAATNGLEAVEQFKLLKPHMITMDITMPHLDGIETIKRIMAIDDQVRILVVSALADKATAIEALKQGAYGFLCKPFSDLDVAEALEELMEDLVDA